MLSLIALLSLAPNAHAQWPQESQWQPITLSGTNLTDHEEDINGSDRLDLVGELSAPVAYWAFTNTTLFFRITVNGQPCSSTNKGAECTNLYPGSWAILMSIDDDDLEYEHAVVLSEYGVHLQLVTNDPPQDTVGGWQDPWEVVVYDIAQPLLKGSARVTEADTLTSGDEDHHIDLQVPISVLTKHMGTDVLSNLRVAIATDANAEPNQMGSDVAGTNSSSGTQDLYDVLSDRLGYDSDNDGILDIDEQIWGTDIDDADTDDDGISDLDEIDWGIDPTECDTDEDGLPDGLELGVTSPNTDTDTKTGCFIQDADPDSTTDPTAFDTDKGGITDGEEDINANGFVDTWETDPNNPDDDNDEDKNDIPDELENACGSDSNDGDDDGISNGDEGLIDSDGDGLPDFCDEDDDNDTLLTIIEGNTDTDADNTPDHLDLDSDNDGKLDEEEGTEDDDCDEIPNFQDPNDRDGPCGDPLQSDNSDPGAHGLSGGHFTGGACGVVSVKATLAPLSIVALILIGFRRKRQSVPVIMVFFGAMHSVHAQEVDAQRLQPAIDATRFIVCEDTNIGHYGSAAALMFNYAHDPLVYRYNDPDQTSISLLGDVATANLLAHYNFMPVQLGIDLPVHIFADGDRIDDAGFHAIGDMRLQAKTRLRKRTNNQLGLSTIVGVGIPTGNGAAWLGDAATTWAGKLNAAIGRDVVINANVGAEYSPKSVGQLFDNTRWGSRLTWALGISAQVRPALWLSTEVDGQRFLFTGTAPGNAPTEAIVSMHTRLSRSVYASLGGSTGITTGIGAPEYRVLLRAKWSPSVMQHQSTRITTTDTSSPFQVNLTVTDPEGQPIGAWLNIPDREFQTQLGVDGRFLGDLPAGSYEIILHTEGYVRAHRMVRGEAGDESRIEVVLYPSRVEVRDNRLVLAERIFFELDSDVITKESFSLLDEIALIVNEHPEFTMIEIQGHTDDQGDGEYNQALSSRRAKSVKRYLVEQGSVESNRLVSLGFGENQPLQPNDSDQARETNRRVDFVVVGTSN